MAIPSSTWHTHQRSHKLKPPRRHAEPPEEDWVKLAKAITEIQNHNASKLSFEEHYRYAYRMVLHKEGTKLFHGVRDIVSNHLDDEVMSKIVPSFPPMSNGIQNYDCLTNVDASKDKGKGRADAPDAPPPPSRFGRNAAERLVYIQAGERFLKAVRDVWEDHVSCMKKLRDVLKYMDKVYTTSPGNGYSSMPTVWDLGHTLFLTHIVRSAKQPLGPTLIFSILGQIRLDREGEAINRSVIRSCTDMLEDLSNISAEMVEKIGDVGGGSASGIFRNEFSGSVYRTDFEPQLLIESTRYFQALGARLLARHDAPAYLEMVDKRLVAEEDRLSHYLHPSTGPPLQSILNKFLIEVNIQGILQHPSSGLDHMIEQERYPDLHRMYRLFARVPPKGHDMLKEGVKMWVKTRGTEINKTLLDASESNDGSVAVASNATTVALQWVQTVLDLREKALRLLKTGFMSDKSFQTVINEAFTSFVNANRRASEFVSLFLDDNLKKGLKGKTETEVDQVLEQTISLFRYISEKDIFERYYKTHLAKRLLFGRYVSDDAERSMLAKLKVECGAAFTRDLEGMLKDLKMSAEMAKIFKDWCAKPGSPTSSIDLTVTVGSSSMWPMYQSKSSCVFPSEFQEAIRAYEAFYGQRHSGRKLSWHGELGNVDMRVKFAKTTHELNVSTFSAVVLLLFQDVAASEGLSYHDIKTGTAIPDADLRRTLQSLACAKYKILNKTPKGRDIDDNDVFAFNANFTSPMARIKILTVTNKAETGQEVKETQDRVDEDRRLITEACIVRIMKTRKALAFTELNLEVMSQLSRRFKPTPMAIKTAVEKLIEKEYLTRNANDRSQLCYQA